MLIFNRNKERFCAEHYFRWTLNDLRCIFLKNTSKSHVWTFGTTASPASVARAASRKICYTILVVCELVLTVLVNLSFITRIINLFNASIVLKVYLMQKWIFCFWKSKRNWIAKTEAKACVKTARNAKTCLLKKVIWIQLVLSAIVL